MTATLADAAAIADLERAAMGDEAWTGTQVAEELEASGRVIRSWREGAAPTGWIDLAAAGDTADLLRVAVHPGARRRGIARRLLDDAVTRLPAGTERLLLEVAATNGPARGLYAEAGFVEIARRARYYRDGTDAVVMQLALQGEDRR